MKVLVLGGTRFVGRAIVADAIDRGFDVTVVSRGESGPPPAEVSWVRADRTAPDALQPLAASAWDAVIDTWDGAADVVARSAALLARAASWYGYVSSRSVYRWPIPPGSDESAPLIDPETDTGYAADKRGAEIAIEAYFAGRYLLARAGLIVGPYEDTGRLTWWLQRAAAGGWMVAPEPADLPWQLLDARDLASFMLSAATDQTTGAYNVVCPRSDGITTKRLVEACAAATDSRVQLRWVPAALLARAGIEPWNDLPGWSPPNSEAAALHDGDVSAALAAGLACRPIEATVADTWAWLQTLPPNARRPPQTGLSRRGLTAEQEQSIWWLTAGEPY
jgi:2'-hydroxyisoflavone reductase